MRSGTELRNNQQELQRFRVRLALGAAFILFAFSLLASRLFYLQVMQHEHYHTLAENNRISIVPIVPNRGLILDRNGLALAHNYSAYTLEITPSKAGNLEETINGLAGIIEITPRDRRRFKKLMEESKNFETLPIRSRLTEVEVAKFAVNRYRFPGVDIKARNAGPLGSEAIERVFRDHYERAGLAYELLPFDPGSDLPGFLEAGIPSGGLFGGSQGIKTAAQAVLFGGAAGVAYDPCFHNACDTYANVSLDVLDQQADAAAFAILTYAMGTESVNGQ